MTMPILDIQKRARELGRIRIGQVVPTTKRDGTTGTRPEKLDRFRLTSASKPLLERVAALYGGTVTEWQPQGGGAAAWEVVTDSQRLPIMVPPQPISQWYEFWTAGGCKHRCDGRTNVLTDELCDPDDYGHTEALKRPTTRLNVVLRDVEGIGVWRLETHGWNAAVELPDSAEFLAAAGGYVNGWVSLEPRTSKAEVPDGQGGTKIQTRHFHVPIIEIDVTPAQLMAGHGRVSAPAIEGPVQQQAPALEGPGDPYAEYFAGLGEAGSLDDLAALWDAGVKANLVGTNATPSPRATEFVAAFKARAQELKPSQEPKANPDGTYDAEVVEDQPATTPPPTTPAEPDPDAIWQQILKAAHEKHTWGLSEVAKDFMKTMGMIPDEATGAELAAYLHTLTTGEEPAA